MKRVAGIDEAGRGCVLGPLVVACVVADDADRRWFARQNVRDSKIVPGPERDELAERIKERCWFRISIATPVMIDEAVRDRTRTLNGLELEMMAELLAGAQLDHDEDELRAVIDAPSFNAQGFREMLFERAGWNEMDRLASRHRADATDRTVAAASIIAKAERERLIAKLKTELGVDFGCGYCHDPLTKAHLKAAPQGAAYVRWSWKTAQAI